MKNQTQIAQDINLSRGRQQTADKTPQDRQSSDRAAILFDSLYDDIREKTFDEAACLFKALLELIKHHPGMKEERAALTLIVQGDEQLQNCQAVKRSQALNN